MPESPFSELVSWSASPSSSSMKSIICSYGCLLLEWEAAGGGLGGPLGGELSALLDPPRLGTGGCIWGSHCCMLRRWLQPLAVGLSAAEVAVLVADGPHDESAHHTSH